jgi:uncharacterized membrane protein YbhN (UPF0104 family)
MSTPSRGARALRIAGNVMAVAGVVFVCVKLRASLTALPALTVDAHLISAIVLGVVVNVVGLALASSSWRALLNGVGVDAPWRVCAGIVGRSNIAKYVPGNIFHLVGRVGLAADAGLPSALVVATLTAETAMVIGVAGVLGAPAAISRLQSITSAPPMLTVMLALVAAAGVLVALAVVLRRRGITIPLRAVSTVVALDVVTYLIHGTAIWWLLLGLLPDMSTAAMPWWVCVSGFSLAWVLGFVVPGAPGGIGIREAVFVALLGTIDVDAAVAAAVSATVIIGRLQSIVGDVVVFVVATLARDQRRVATNK